MIPTTGFKEILFCTDFSPNADNAFIYACQMARVSPGAQMTILHVIPDPEAQFWNNYLPELDHFEAQARIDVTREIAERYVMPLNGAIDAEIVILFGKDSAEILTYLQTHPVDLIVMGRQGKSEWGSLFFGNVTEKVSRHADCAVLIVPMSFVEKKQPIQV